MDWTIDTIGPWTVIRRYKTHEENLNNLIIQSETNHFHGWDLLDQVSVSRWFGLVRKSLVKDIIPELCVLKDEWRKNIPYI